MIVLFGLSGAGKTTLGNKVLEYLDFKYPDTFISVDGDVVRKNTPNLKYSKEDRLSSINIKIAVINEFIKEGKIPLCTFCLGLKKQRDVLRAHFPNIKFVWLKCSIDECKRRDPKGLYEKFENNEINNMLGLDIEYLPPGRPDLIVDTEEFSEEECVNMIVNFICTDMNS